MSEPGLVPPDALQPPGPALPPAPDEPQPSFQMPYSWQKGVVLLVDNGQEP